MENLSPIMLGFLGSLAAGSLTAVGAAPVLFGRIPSRATRDLSLGFASARAPLGLIMLALIVALAAVFLIYIVVLQAGMMSESRRVAKELKAQRELADKAEASRFTELRAFLEAQHSQAHAAVLARLDHLEARLAARAEESDNTTAAYVGQLEQQLRSRHALGTPVV